MKTPSEKIKEGVESLELEIKYSRETLGVFREKFKAKSNMEALDNLVELFRTINDMYAGHVKYPQLQLPEMQESRLKNMRKLINLKGVL